MKFDFESRKKINRILNTWYVYKEAEWEFNWVLDNGNLCYLYKGRYNDFSIHRHFTLSCLKSKRKKEDFNNLILKTENGFEYFCSLDEIHFNDYFCVNLELI